MSYSQFAEAITSFGQGTGIPVTICYTEIPPCDFVSKREQFTGELKEQTDKAMEKSKELINEVAELFSSKKTLTKADKKYFKKAQYVKLRYCKQYWIYCRQI